MSLVRLPPKSSARPPLGNAASRDPTVSGVATSTPHGASSREKDAAEDANAKSTDAVVSAQPSLKAQISDVRAAVDLFNAEDTGDLIVGQFYEVTESIAYGPGEEGDDSGYILPQGLVGKVLAVDAEGDAEIDCGGSLGLKFVLKDDQHKLKRQDVSAERHEGDNEQRLATSNAPVEDADERPFSRWSTNNIVPTKSVKSDKVVPQILVVKGAGGCDGRYQLLPEQIDGLPLWRRSTPAGHEAPQIWIFSSVSKRWVFGGEKEAAANFVSDSGFLASRKRHRGRWPHEVPAEGWLSYDEDEDQWNPVPEIGVVEETPSVTSEGQLSRNAALLRRIELQMKTIDALQSNRIERLGTPDTPVQFFFPDKATEVGANNIDPAGDDTTRSSVKGVVQGGETAEPLAEERVSKSNQEVDAEVVQGLAVEAKDGAKNGTAFPKGAPSPKKPIPKMASGMQGAEDGADADEASIRHSLAVEEENKMLSISVLSAAGLRDADKVGGKSDPYCTIEIQDGKGPLAKTKVQPNTSNPEWNEDLILKGYGAGQTIVFKLWDKDNTKKDDFLGTATVTSDLFLKSGGSGILDLKLAKAGKGVDATLKVKIIALDEQLRADLKGLTLGGLKKKAKEEQLVEEDFLKIIDDADDPVEAMVNLIVNVRQAHRSKPDTTKIRHDERQDKPTPSFPSRSPRATASGTSPGNWDGPTSSMASRSPKASASLGMLNVTPSLPSNLPPRSRDRPDAASTSPGVDTDAVARQIMQSADRLARNGELSITELKAFLGAGTVEGRNYGDFMEWLTESGRMRFMHWDGNHDGAISLRELTGAVAEFFLKENNPTLSANVDLVSPHSAIPGHEHLWEPDQEISSAPSPANYKSRARHGVIDNDHDASTQRLAMGRPSKGHTNDRTVFSHERSPQDSQSGEWHQPRPRILPEPMVLNSQSGLHQAHSRVASALNTDASLQQPQFQPQPHPYPEHQRTGLPNRLSCHRPPPTVPTLSATPERGGASSVSVSIPATSWALDAYLPQANVTSPVETHGEAETKKAPLPEQSLLVHVPSSQVSPSPRAASRGRARPVRGGKDAGKSRTLEQTNKASVSPAPSSRPKSRPHSKNAAKTQDPTPKTGIRASHGHQAAVDTISPFETPGGSATETPALPDSQRIHVDAAGFPSLHSEWSEPQDSQKEGNAPYDGHHLGSQVGDAVTDSSCRPERSLSSERARSPPKPAALVQSPAPTRKATRSPAPKKTRTQTLSATPPPLQAQAQPLEQQLAQPEVEMHVQPQEQTPLPTATQERTQTPPRPTTRTPRTAQSGQSLGSSRNAASGRPAVKAREARSSPSRGQKALEENGTAAASAPTAIGFGNVDGKVYMGFRNAHGDRSGYGVMRGKDGTVYTGQWRDGQRNGNGTLFFEGGVFEGQWRNGDAVGAGTVHFKNGDSFVGEYVDNKKCGPGVYRWADGAEESGNYADGGKVGWHRWQQGDDEWNLLYEPCGVVAAAKRTEAAEARLAASKRPSTVRERTATPPRPGAGKQPSRQHPLPRWQSANAVARTPSQAPPRTVAQALRPSSAQVEAPSSRLRPPPRPRLNSTAIAVG